MTRRSAAFVLLLALVCAPAQSRQKSHGPEVGRSFADPSTILEVELAFNRLAREKGQWTAFRETAADDAVMFAPEMTLAKDWLKGRADPSAPVQWQPQRIYVSCDGRTAASTGGWEQPDGSVGYFTTIWRLDRKGGWKWVLDHGDRLEKPLPSSDFVDGRIAVCRRHADVNRNEDDSLIWSYEANGAGREVRVRMWNGTGYETVIDDKVAP